MIFYQNKLKKIRKEKFISQTALAKLMNCSRKTIARWEFGVTVPKVNDVYKLAKALDISPELISDLSPKIEKSNVKISSLINSILSNNEPENKPQQHVSNILRETVKLGKELKVSSMLIETILTAVPFAFYIKNPDLKYITVNSEFLNIVGIKNNYDVFGKTDEDFFSTRDAKDNSSEDSKVINSGISIHNLEKYIPGTRRLKYGLVSKLPIYDERENIAGLIGVFFDITERKKYESELKMLHKALGRLNSGDAIFMGKYLDSSHKHLQIDFFSQSLTKLTRLTPDDFLKNTRAWEELIHDDSKEYFKIENKKQWGSPEQFYKLKLVNQYTGESNWFNYHYYEEKNYCLAIFTIVKKVILKPNPLKSFESLLFNSNDSIIILDTSTEEVIFVSEKFEEFYGYHPSFLYDDLYFRISQCVHPDDKAQEMSYLNSFNFPESRQFKIIKPDKSELILEETATEFKTSDAKWILLAAKKCNK